MNHISFKVAPYALFDTLKALHNTSDQHRRIEYFVTKEDNDLVVHVHEFYIGKHCNCQCKASNGE